MTGIQKRCSPRLGNAFACLLFVSVDAGAVDSALSLPPDVFRRESGLRCVRVPYRFQVAKACQIGYQAEGLPHHRWMYCTTSTWLLLRRRKLCRFLFSDPRRYDSWSGWLTDQECSVMSPRTPWPWTWPLSWQRPTVSRPRRQRYLLYGTYCTRPRYLTSASPATDRMALQRTTPRHPLRHTPPLL